MLVLVASAKPFTATHTPHTIEKNYRKKREIIEPR